jgi:hypothetical protein
MENKDCEPTLPLMFETWFDECDPNNQSKTNRGAVFIRTLTFSPASNARNNLQNTYPFAIGPKGCDRGVIDDRLQITMREVNYGDKNGKRKKFTVRFWEQKYM